MTNEVNKLTDKDKKNILQSFIRKVPKLMEASKQSIQQDIKNQKFVFREIMNNLIPLYNEKIFELQNKLSKKEKMFKRLYKKTIFEIMDKHTKEEVHSNIIAYLLKMIIIQRKIIKYLIEKQDKPPALSKCLRTNQNFTIIREKNVKGKRIDIFIESRDCIIVIENKFNDSLHDVNDNESQTDFYKKEIDKQYPNKEKYYFILDYKNRETSEGYTTISYDDLLEILENIISEYQILKESTVVMEYLYLLRRLEAGIINKEIKKINEIKTLSQSYMIFIGGEKWI